MIHGSLFSGIGGFDLAAEWMGWENKFHCEWNPFGQRILKHYWPNATSYNNIKQTDFSIHHRSIDILTGGFPCQPYSQAGKRLGKEDERHLWPEMLRAIREIQPRYVVGENVRGLTNWNGGMVFDEVQADLETQGYEVLPFLLPACSVNAPHRRDRIWFIAHANHTRDIARRCRTDRNGQTESSERKQSFDEFSGSRIKGLITDTSSEGREEWKQDRGCEDTAKNRTGMEFWHKRFGNNGDATNTDGIGLLGQSDGVGKSRQFGKTSAANNWENFPTQSPLCNGDDGFPSQLDGITFSKWRNESIKGGGNAIVPQVVFEIFKAIKKYEAL